MAPTRRISPTRCCQDQACTNPRRTRSSLRLSRRRSPAGRMSLRSSASTVYSSKSSRGVIFDVTGPAYAAYYNEVKAIGDAGCVARSRLHRERHRALLAGRRVELEPDGTHDRERQRPGPLAARTPVRALNMAQADALIANQTWKYTYTFWRPVTAIRWPDDGNPETASDPVWRPFLVTPPIPIIPCACRQLRAQRRSAAAVLRHGRRAVHAQFNRAGGAVAGADDGAAGQDDYTNVRVAVRRGRGSAETRAYLQGYTSAKAARRVRARGRRVGRFVVRHSLQPVKGR